jgi:Fe-S-cluster containining protein
MRIAIVGPSPCQACHANCCKQNGHEYAVLLEESEWRKFAPFCEKVRVDAGEGVVATERVLPYVNGRCQFLEEDDRCTIYEDRPINCRKFECAPGFDSRGAHSAFLQRNPDVLQLLTRA